MFKRRALTLIEVLVTIGIIGLLLAILLPALQSAREAARRTQCSSNLSQIGIAFNGYLTLYGVFPAAGMNGSKDMSYFQSSPFCRILPGLEQQELYHSLNFDIPQSPFSPINTENTSAVSVSLSVFLCPTDGGPTLSATGALSYRVNLGAGYKIFASLMGPTEPGAFEFHRWISPADFRDGLTYTALVSERLRGGGDPTGWDPARDPWYAGFSRNPPYPIDTAIDYCASVPSGVPPHSSIGGTSWFRNGFDYAWYNHATGVNSRIPDCTDLPPEAGIRGSPGSGIYAARSFHGGGALVLTADGSVHWVKGGVALPIWRALGTRAGQETCGPPF
ncbi:DUF1559 family PulG-like putative transporter [Aquisphaera insulae]|uniref:DUF1559 family PulG-like putative transporter n=1 Tax=Aquisphaera insulae TaxID=2712864 RepID=UPI0013E9ED01|nr:DUF1559 domain-containing protein [Aquisphaera insulae]